MPSQPYRRRAKPQTKAAQQTAFQPLGEKRKSRKPEAAGPTKRTENSPFCTTKSLAAAAKRAFSCVQKPLKPLKRQYSNEPFPAIFLYKTHESLPISVGLLLTKRSKLDNESLGNTGKDGLKGQQIYSPGHRPGYVCWCYYALKGQKLLLRLNDFAPMGRLYFGSLPPGRCPGLWGYCPFGVLFLSIYTLLSPCRRHTFSQKKSCLYQTASTGTG